MRSWPRVEAVIARAALGTIFSTAIITALLQRGSWHADRTLAVVVSAVAVGLVSGVFVLSAGTIGRFLSRVFPPAPWISTDGAVHRRGADHNRSLNARCNLI
jgi:hypothetical protein